MAFDTLFDSLFLLLYFMLWFLVCSIPVGLLVLWAKWSIRNDKRKAAYERLVQCGRRPPKNKNKNKK